MTADVRTAAEAVPVFRFTNAQWREYQQIPVQGYSHRHWIEHQVNEWATRVTPTREQLDAVARKTLIEFTGTCVCHEAYTSRGKEDPDCVWHAVGDEFPGDLADAVLALMQELTEGTVET